MDDEAAQSGVAPVPVAAHVESWRRCRLKSLSVQIGSGHERLSEWSRDTKHPVRHVPAVGAVDCQRETVATDADDGNDAVAGRVDLVRTLADVVARLTVPERQRRRLGRIDWTEHRRTLFFAVDVHDNRAATVTLPDPAGEEISAV